ncbi:hypothetical protein ABZY58_11885 [Micromonospora tulbaghiae]|uniref:hypothetical protein n=1 Tax=Micromonospora tulbaghiae TaxID=479978 RepID=UPI00339E4C08
MTEPLLPGSSPTTCSCCHRPVPTGRVYGPGLGEKCARRRGYLPPRQPRTVRPAVVVQDGPDLFDAANQTAHITHAVPSGIMYAVPADRGRA